MPTPSVSVSLSVAVLFNWFGQLANSVYIIGLWSHHHPVSPSLSYVVIVILCQVILGTVSTGTTSYVACIFAYFPINAHWVIWAYAILVAFEGYICWWHIFCKSMVNECSSLFVMDVCSNAGLYVDYRRSAVGHKCAVWQAFLFRGLWQYCEMYVYQCSWSHC